MDSPSTTSTTFSDLVREVWELVVAYAKQETVEPAKNLGRFVAWGMAGSVMLAVGLSLGVLAGLRVLQTETGDTFEAGWSWAPYAITAGACLMLIAAALGAASRTRK